MFRRLVLVTNTCSLYAYGLRADTAVNDVQDHKSGHESSSDTKDEVKEAYVGPIIFKAAASSSRLVFGRWNKSSKNIRVGKMKTVWQRF